MEHMETLLLEINNRIKSEHILPFEDEFIQCLKIKSIPEKLHLSKHFCGLEWDVGSCHMLSIYQKVYIISATEYIFSKNDQEQVQIVMNNFLASEFELLSNLVFNSYYDSVISAILKECFRRFIKEFLEHIFVRPDNNTHNKMSYLTSIKTLVPDDVYLDICLMHCNLLLADCAIEISDCFGKFDDIISQSENPGLKSYLLQIVQTYEKEIVYRLFYLSSQPLFKGWHFYIILMRMIGTLSCPTLATCIKKQLKGLVCESGYKRDASILFNAIITARSVCYTENENFKTYRNWYQSNVCEIKFVINNPEFINIMGCLTELVQHETDEKYLLMHCAIGISCGPETNKYVLHYKEKCNERLYVVSNGRLGKTASPE